MKKVNKPVVVCKTTILKQLDKAAVDFVIRSGAAVKPLEVKYSNMKKLEAQRSYRGFLERYNPERGYIVNKSLSNEAMLGETRVRCLPYWELMFEEAFSVSA